KRERPTCTERNQSLLRECGWKHGDSGKLGRRDKSLSNEKQNKPLDSDRPSHGRRFRSEPFGYERNGDATTVDARPFPTAGVESRGCACRSAWRSCSLPCWFGVCSISCPGSVAFRQ